LRTTSLMKLLPSSGMIITRLPLPLSIGMISLLTLTLLMRSLLLMLTITTITSHLKPTCHTSHLQFTGLTIMKSQLNNSGLTTTDLDHITLKNLLLHMFNISPGTNPLNHSCIMNHLQFNGPFTTNNQALNSTTTINQPETTSKSQSHLHTVNTSITMNHPITIFLMSHPQFIGLITMKNPPLISIHTIITPTHIQ
jgi:hypothetical protein